MYTLRSFVAKPLQTVVVPASIVRMRRAYFDCRFGQLHVRTAFPSTGGFDEGTPLFCLHAHDGSSRTFTLLLPEIAYERSVYAPDLPGFGESDAPPEMTMAAAAAAVADLAKDLRLRQIDVLGIRSGAAVAFALANAHPELVRRLVLFGVELDAQGIQRSLTEASCLELPEHAAELCNAAPKTLATQIGAFLNG